MRTHAETTASPSSWRGPTTTTEPLTAGEEAALVARWRDHRDRSALARLVASQLPWLLSLADKGRRSAALPDDLIAEGCVGLLIALQTMDLRIGIRLREHATPLVLARLRRTVTLEQSVVSRPSVHPVGGAARPRRDASLDVDDGSRFDGVESPQASLEQAETRARVRVAIERSHLGPRERHLLRHRLMADAEDVVTLDEVGLALGVSPEHAHLLEARLVRKLRGALRQAAA